MVLLFHSLDTFCSLHPDAELEEECMHCGKKKLYPLHSHQSTAHLNQTGPTTDTYGVIWHIHFTYFLCIHEFNANSNKMISCMAARLKMNRKGFKFLLHWFTQTKLVDGVCSYMHMPNSDAEKVTVKGSHGTAACRGSQTALGSRGQVSWQGSAVQSAPQGPKQKTHEHLKASHTKSDRSTAQIIYAQM